MLGGISWRWRLGVLGLCGLSACLPLTPATTRQLASRAAFDLSCSTTELQIYQLDGRTRGVLGCGRRLVYVEMCDRQREPACVWLVDTPPTYGTTMQRVSPLTPEPAALPSANALTPEQLYRLED
jgi:hypothetical protein